MTYTPDGRFRVVTDAELPHFLAQHQFEKYTGVDTETYYDDKRPDLLCKFIKDHKQNMPFIVTMSFDGLTGYKIYINSKTVPLLREFLSDPDRDIIMFNADYDLWMLENAGIPVAGRVHDVMILHQLINEEDTSLDGKPLKDLKGCSVKYIAEDADKFERLVDEARLLLAKEKGVSKDDISYKDVDDRFPDLMTDYAGSDPMYTVALYKLWHPLIAKWDLQTVYDIEMDCIPVVQEMERVGHKVSMTEILNLEGELKDSIDKAKKEIYEIAGYDFNINSADELIEAYRRNGIDYRFRNDEGNLSVDEDHLELLLPDKFTELVLQYRADSKLLGTYIENLKFYTQQDGRVHPTFWQTGARTGRFSSSNPNF